MNKKKMATLITILVLSIAVAVPSIVSAAETSTSTRPGSITAYFKELIQGLVDTGKLSQTDADVTLTALDTRIGELKASRFERADRRIGFRHAWSLDLAEAATIIGLTEDQLKEQLSGDTTLWKIAGDAGKLDALKTAMIEKAQTKLAERVTDGSMTAQEAETALSEWKEKIAAITAESKDSTLGSFGGRGGKGDPGRYGDFGVRTKGSQSESPSGKTKGSTSTTTAIPNT